MLTLKQRTKENKGKSEECWLIGIENETWKTNTIAERDKIWKLLLSLKEKFGKVD